MATDVVLESKAANVEMREGKPFLKLDRILFCTDFSPVSARTQEIVECLAQRTDARVIVFHAMDVGPMAATSDEGEAYVETKYAEKRQQVEEVAKEIRSAGISADSIFVDGTPGTSILEQARWSEPGMIAMGTRSTRGVERLMVGSTAEMVFRQAACPTLTVGWKCRLYPLEDAVPKIVLATEFQQQDRETLLFAAALANSVGGRLHVMHVLPVGADPSWAMDAKMKMFSALHDALGEQNVLLHTAVTEVVWSDETSHAITEYAEKLQAAFIVLGIRSKGRMAAHMPAQRVFNVIEQASCPVITLARSGRT